MVGKTYIHPRFGLVQVIASNLKGRKKDNGVKRQVTVRAKDGKIIHCPWGRWKRDDKGAGKPAFCWAALGMTQAEESRGCGRILARGVGPVAEQPGADATPAP